ncbi:hypothetical protein ACP70R_022981 [Stipagrostis hirtigluma subsp. patula]
MHYKEEHEIELPCFTQTASLMLNFGGFTFKLPRSGEFTKLTSLKLKGSSIIDPAELLLMCPSIRVLELKDCWLPDTVKVHSESLQVLCVCTGTDVRCMDIDTAALQAFDFTHSRGHEFTLSFSA